MISRLNKMAHASEGSGKALAPVKLGNAVLAMVWGFASTFVFARMLATTEFTNFVLLIALANFTIAAEFGFSNILYRRLRDRVLAASGDFSMRELWLLIAALGGVIVTGAAAILTAMYAGVIETRFESLFIAVFALAALNMVVLVVKRALAALDRNMAFELIDTTRRIVSLALLLSVLAGLDLTLSIGLQLLLVLAELALLLGWTQRLVKALPGHETESSRSSASRTTYGKLATPAIMLTLFEIAGYNLPFIIIAALTRDIRPLLLFDLLYKLLRTVGIVARVGAESALPRITRAASQGDEVLFLRSLGKAIGFGTTGAVALAILVLIAGPWLSEALYHGKLTATFGDFAIMAFALIAVPVITVSTQVNGAFSRFSPLASATGLLTLTALVAPLAAARLVKSWADLFLLLYVFGYLIACARHGWLLLGLVRDPPRDDPQITSIQRTLP